MSTKIFAGVLSLCLLSTAPLLAADDPPSDPTLVGDQARAARDASAVVEDSALEAYNDHLAELATVPKKKIWGH